MIYIKQKLKIFRFVIFFLLLVLIYTIEKKDSSYNNHLTAHQENEEIKVIRLKENSENLWTDRRKNIDLQKFFYTDTNPKIYSIAFSPDGKYSAFSNDNGLVQIWDIVDNKVVHTLKSHTAPVNDLSFSPDGKHIVTGSSDKTIKLWNLEGNLLKTIKGHHSAINNIIFCNDEQKIISSSTDNNIKIWTKNGILLGTHNSQLDNIDKIDCGVNNKFISAVDRDGKILLLNFANKNFESSKIFSVKWNKDSMKSHNIFLEIELEEIDYGKKYLLNQLDDKGLELEFNPELVSKEIIVLAVYRNLLYQSDLSYEISSPVYKNGVFAYVKENKVSIFSKKSHKTLDVKKRVTTIDIHPKSNKIFIGCEDGTLSVWDINNGRLIKTIQAHGDRVVHIEISHDGKTITSKSNNKNTKKWNTNLSNNFEETIYIIVVLLVVFFVFISSLIIIDYQRNKKYINISKNQACKIRIQWVIDAFPDDWIANLEGLRSQEITKGKSGWYVSAVTFISLIDMILGDIRVKLQDLYQDDDLITIISNFNKDKN